MVLQELGAGKWNVDDGLQELCEPHVSIFQ